jgi:hypothetical protein
VSSEAGQYIASAVAGDVVAQSITGPVNLAGTAERQPLEVRPEMEDSTVSVPLSEFSITTSPLLSTT